MDKTSTKARWFFQIQLFEDGSMQKKVITEDEAQKISAALEGLRALMTGGELGAAFADLEQSGPSLPPHLQAAMETGKKIV
jgi:hydrogenase expression/formation protein HypC